MFRFEKRKKILVCLRKANSCLERSASYWIEKENNCYPTPHYWRKRRFSAKSFCLSFERNTLLLLQHFLVIMNKREHEVVKVNRLQSQLPPYLDWFKVLLKISAKKGATLQYFNLEEQQQSQIKLKFLLKYACSQKSKNIFPQSISKLSNIPSLFCLAQILASSYCIVHT